MVSTWKDTGEFRVSDAKCFDPTDRPLVEGNIACILKRKGFVAKDANVDGNVGEALRDEHGDLDQSELEDLLECPDDNWGKRQFKRKKGPLGSAGYTVEGWCATAFLSS